MTYRPSIAERIAWTTALSPSDAKVLQALASCGDWETGQRCYPRLKTIAARAGLSIATVTRRLRRLEDPTHDDGPWIVATVRRHRHSTTYDLQLDRLATCPPKEQQTTMTTVLDPPRSDAQNEQQTRSVAQNEQQPPGSVAQNEQPTSDPDLDLLRTTTTRAREDAAARLPLLGRPAPRRCAHPHAHAWCEGRVHVPKDLHFEFLAQLGTRPGESPVAKVGRLIAFYAATMMALPATQTIAVDGYTFWKGAFKAWVIAEAAREPITRVPEPARYDAVWQQILERIETKLDRHTFHTWFRPLVMVTDHPTATGPVIEVTKNGPDGGLFVAWIPKHYAALVQAAVDEVRPGSRVEVIDAWGMEGGDRREGTG